METHKNAMALPLNTLKEQAVTALKQVIPGIIEWTESVRPYDGTRGRFRWANESTRDANVAATAYILGGSDKMGIKDRIWTNEDRQAGEEWIRAMHIGDQQYRDPALMERRSPNWPDDKPWPSPAMLGGINQYARNVLKSCVNNIEELPPDSPPPGWPQATDNPDLMLGWVRTRPYDENAWGACSHGMRMATYMLRWHKEGKIPLQPVIDALNFFYSIQDPQTGLWGTADQPKNVRINGTFKLFPLLRENLDLPLPHAGKIIDQVMSEFDRPDYDETVCGCDEWDNWYVIGLAGPEAPSHRAEEIKKTAAWRISRVLEVFSQSDGGLSFHPAHCNTSWIGFDMAPQLPQGDAMGPGILAGGINVCIDLTDLHDATAWSGVWRMRSLDDEPLRNAILEGLNADIESPSQKNVP
ncbi:MAG: hypothetical protein ACLFWL_03480 [Candidatus Brocadiia bacterium]